MWVCDFGLYTRFSKLLIKPEIFKRRNSIKDEINLFLHRENSMIVTIQVVKDFILPLIALWFEVTIIFQTLLCMHRLFFRYQNMIQNMLVPCRI